MECGEAGKRGGAATAKRWRTGIRWKKQGRPRKPDAEVSVRALEMRLFREGLRKRAIVNPTQSSRPGTTGKAIV